MANRIMRLPFVPGALPMGSPIELGVEFTDTEGVGGGGFWDPVPTDVVETIAYRTPGFNGWQQEQWWTHCHHAAEFIGRAG
jgi:hypothetical protein